MADNKSAADNKLRAEAVRSTCSASDNTRRSCSNNSFRNNFRACDACGVYDAFGDTRRNVYCARGSFARDSPSAAQI